MGSEIMPSKGDKSLKIKLVMMSRTANRYFRIQINSNLAIFKEAFQ